eukprot:CAMPEP_0116027402 /NCGR_PEP_ID=MMETSP0321-20121206/14619_1 /TAXON_ID=163516 /ORGANISM="Leptocylindrus danicus var. danicus, Strain B650" /LENGTH=285 /DNA_ID=CAMNT_0003500773 /DNA_START=53 /DNA_END=910 /DNA_ORIENTATION=+
MSKHILVTGGNKGIGKAICQRILEQYPDTCVILGSRNVQRGEEACRDILSTCNNNNIAKDRLSMVQIDTSSDASVQKAAEEIAQKFQAAGVPSLYGIVNNAGIGWGHTFEQTLQTNYFGPKRVNAAFGNLLQKPGGRIVNIASASGPMFVAGLQDSNNLKDVLSFPLKAGLTLEDLDDIARGYFGQTDYNSDGYGLSKALLNAYTVIYAQENGNNLVMNSCSPGYILTDMTRGMGASNPPSKGAECPVTLLMEDGVATGWYYGSDSVRSPLNVYRGPGDPPYEGE